MTKRQPPSRRRRAPRDDIPEPRSAGRLDSRAKGATAERELAELLRAHGYFGALRGQQRAGTEAADVVGGPNSVHFECKAVESADVLHAAIRQAERDATAQAARDGCAPRLPVVAWKRRRAGWVAALDLGAFVSLVRELETLRADAAHRTVATTGRALSTVPAAERARGAIDATLDTVRAARAAREARGSAETVALFRAAEAGQGTDGGLDTLSALLASL